MTSLDISSIPRDIKDVVLDAVEQYGLTPASFAKACGFRNTEKMYHITSGRNKPGFETLCAFIAAFPELNGDRFIRGTGPILLKDVNLKVTPTEIATPVKLEDFRNSGSSHLQDIIKEKDKQIEMLEKQVAFLQELLKK